MIETFRAMDWIDWMVSTKEWEEKAKLAVNVCAIYTPKDKLHQVFSGTGELIRPMELRLTGDISGIPALIAQCNLNACLMMRDFWFIGCYLTHFVSIRGSCPTRFRMKKRI
jgi:hypothetical protein